MPSPRRELRKYPVSAKITSTDHAKLIAACEKNNMSVSEYIYKALKESFKND